MMNRTIITAHSGCLSSAPNTVESIQTGLARGAEFSEVDVRLTSDGEVILYHNKDIETRYGGPVRINETPFKKLKKLQSDNELIMLHDHSEITLLSEALAVLKTIEGKLILDIKDDLCLPVLAEMLRAENLTQRVVVSGCKKITASYFKNSYPDFQVFLNAETSGLKANGKDDLNEIQAICDDAVLSSCCGINIEYKYCTPLMVDLARKSFLAVSIWTVNDQENMKRFIHMGVDNITTLYPHILRSLIEEEELR